MPEASAKHVAGVRRVQTPGKCAWNPPLGHSREDLLASRGFPDRDRHDRAVAGGLDQVVARSAVRVDHDRLLVVVELEDARSGRDAVPEAVAELAIDLDHEAVVRCGRAHAATGSST